MAPKTVSSEDDEEHTTELVCERQKTILTESYDRSTLATDGGADVLEPREGFDALVDAVYGVWFHHNDEFLKAISAGQYVNGDRIIVLRNSEEETYELRVPVTDDGYLDVPDTLDLDALRETEQTAFIRDTCPKNVGMNWVFHQNNARDEYSIVYAGGERRVVDTPEGERGLYDEELHLTESREGYEVKEWSLERNDVDGSAEIVRAFDTLTDAWAFMQEKMDADEELPLSFRWSGDDASRLSSDQ